MLLKIKTCREWKSILFQDIRTLLDPVQTERPDTLAIIKNANHVIEITVPDESVRTENERFPIVAQLLFLPDIVLKVQEENLLSGIDGLVDPVNDQVNVLVIVFDTVFRGNVPLKTSEIDIFGVLSFHQI